jgi:hypothetical protein
MAQINAPTHPINVQAQEDIQDCYTVPLWMSVLAGNDSREEIKCDCQDNDYDLHVFGLSAPVAAPPPDYLSS